MQLLSIQEVSDRFKIPKSTLRFWEKELDGILVPIRSNGGQRRYTTENISIIEEIKRMRETEMSLAEIKRKLGNSDAGNNSNSDGVDLLAERVAKVVRCNPPHVFSQSSTISPEILEKCFTFPVTKTNL